MLDGVTQTLQKDLIDISEIQKKNLKSRLIYGAKIAACLLGIVPTLTIGTIESINYFYGEEIPTENNPFEKIKPNLKGTKVGVIHGPSNIKERILTCLNFTLDGEYDILFLSDIDNEPSTFLDKIHQNFGNDANTQYIPHGYTTIAETQAITYLATKAIEKDPNMGPISIIHCNADSEGENIWI